MQRVFTIHPSRYLTLTIVLAHVLVMGELCFLPLPKPACVLLLIVLQGSMIYYVLRDAILKLRDSWLALKLEDAGVVLVNRTGEEFTGILQGGSMVTPLLVLLNISMPSLRRKCSLVLMPDSMDAESFRRLRVALKWEIGSGV